MKALEIYYNMNEHQINLSKPSKQKKTEAT